MTEPTKHRKTSFMKTSPALALAAALSLAGCAQYATVSQKKPQFRPVRATVGALVSAERGSPKRCGRRSASRSWRSANSSPQRRRRAATRAQPCGHRRARRLQLRRRPRPRHDQAGEARSVDAAAARAGGGRRLRAHAQARPAPAVESGALRFHARGSIRRQRHLRHASTSARKASARRSSPSDARMN